MSLEDPSARLVRRTELYTRSPTPEHPDPPDPELSALLQRRLAETFGNDYVSKTDERPSPGPNMDGGDNHKDTYDPNLTFEFRLFANAATTTQAGSGIDHKVILEDDTLPLGPGAFIYPHRDPTYYFTYGLSDLSRRVMELCAFTGNDVRRYLGVRYYANEKPWKVQTIPLATINDARGRVEERRNENVYGIKVGSGQRRPKSRTKPNKRKRIVMRRAAKVELEMRQREEAERLTRVDAARKREEVERERKTRLNRAKQLKKRAKEKAKLAGQGGGIDDVQGVKQDVLVERGGVDIP